MFIFTLTFGKAVICTRPTTTITGLQIFSLVAWSLLLLLEDNSLTFIIGCAGNLAGIQGETAVVGLTA